jgi:hypothetical protein
MPIVKGYSRTSQPLFDCTSHALSPRLESSSSLGFFLDLSPGMPGLSFAPCRLPKTHFAFCVATGPSADLDMSDRAVRVGPLHHALGSRRSVDLSISSCLPCGRISR